MKTKENQVSKIINGILESCSGSVNSIVLCKNGVVRAKTLYKKKRSRKV
jgi:hypothetical protein